MTNSQKRRMRQTMRSYPNANSSEPNGSRAGAGIGIDRFGGQVYDPTRNVNDRFSQLIEWGDALRLADKELAQSRNETLLCKIDCQKEMNQLREQHGKEARESEARRLDQARQSESNRLDSIRQVDVLAGQTTATQLANQLATTAAQADTAIKTLAATTQASAETLRIAQGTTAQTVAAQLAALVTPLQQSIAELQKSSYTGAGRQAVSDPLMETLITEVRKLQSTQATSTGKNEGSLTVWIVLVGAIAMLGTFVSIGSILLRSGSPIPPQIIYQPATPPNIGTQNVNPSK